MSRRRRLKMLEDLSELFKSEGKCLTIEEYKALPPEKQKYRIFRIKSIFGSWYTMTKAVHMKYPELKPPKNVRAQEPNAPEVVTAESLAEEIKAKLEEANEESSQTTG